MNVNTNNIEIANATKTISRNPITHKYEQIFAEDEIVTGQTVVILYWSNAQNQHVVIPGASYHTMTANGLQLIEE